MNFFDDFRTRLEQAGQNFGNDLKSYIESNIVQPAVRIGQAATGNLSEAQIRAGQTASAPPMAAPQSQVVSGGIGIVSILAIGALAYLLLAKKSRG